MSMLDVWDSKPSGEVSDQGLRMHLWISSVRLSKVNFKIKVEKNQRVEISKSNKVEVVEYVYSVLYRF